jgi:hypothetical protein
MRKINDLVSGEPSNWAGLWAMTNKQASGVGWAHLKCIRLFPHSGSPKHAESVGRCIFHLTYFSFLADPTSKVLHI